MWDLDYVAIKQKNIIKTEERLYYRFLKGSKVHRD